MTLNASFDLDGVPSAYAFVFRKAEVQAAAKDLSEIRAELQASKGMAKWYTRFQVTAGHFSSPSIVDAIVTREFENLNRTLLILYPKTEKDNEEC